MKHHAIALPFLLALSVACSPCFGGSKTVYGLSEHVHIATLSEVLEAKLDTGAKTSSLSARDISRFKRNNKTWVRFYLAADTAHSEPLELPLVRSSKIKQRHGDCKGDKQKKSTIRPIVELAVCIGDKLRTIEVNLTDRSAFKFPLLIGSEALKDFNAVVDPALEYLAGKPNCSL